FINEIHNGADDNASGVAGMLELMRLVQQMPTKRSIIWVAFAAEEKGLLGSKYFVENPPVSLKNIVAMINLDMIGRLDSISQTLSISGTGTSKIFKKLIQKHAKKFSFNISNNPSGEGPSDHASFYRKNIPVLFIHSGLHEDYHKPTDDADKINFIGMKSIVDFTYLILADIANYPHKIKFSKTKSYQNSEREHKEVKFTLGIIPDVTGSTEGLLVEGVKADGIADKSGIKKGDIIIAINDKPIKNIYDYMNRLNEVENEKTIKIKINRNGQIKEITARVY
ncbi:MAG: M20/M25/M40 family metallo-hydrolase, partial [Bacteroidales bacterium]|nr:M20/M25/M40 family metallo-hydrolase [Bacteroidales bacterium]